jgi:hypothetical protein
MLAACGGDALAADHMLAATGRTVENDRRVAARAVQVRLRDMQSEGRRHGCIEGIAAALQHRHADLARQPVRVGNDAERAGDFWSCGEHAARSPGSLIERQAMR